LEKASDVVETAKVAAPSARDNSWFIRRWID